MSHARPNPHSSVVEPAALEPRALQALAELDPGGTSGLVPRVLKTFAASLVRLTQQLAADRAAGDLSGVRHVAHTLKSSSASLGAMRLSQLCAETERRVRDDEPDGLDGVLDQLAAEAQRVSEAVAALLRE